MSYPSLRRIAYSALTGLALLVSDCGGKSSKPENAFSGDTITIEGKVYLMPEYLLSSEGEAAAPLTSSRRSSLNQTMKILNDGTVTALCSAGVTFDHLDCTDKSYIESATITNGNYSVKVPREAVEKSSVTIVATTVGGDYVTGMDVPNPLERQLYPIPLPEKLTGQDITPEKEAGSKLLYGAMQKIKEAAGSFSYDDLTTALGVGAEFFALVPGYFKNLAIKTVEEYFTKAEDDMTQQQQLGEAYKSKTGSNEDSAALGADLVQRARRIDLGNGNFVEITEENGGEKECPVGKLNKLCRDPCLEKIEPERNVCYQIDCPPSCEEQLGCLEDVNVSKDSCVKECCERLGCKFLAGGSPGVGMCFPK